MKSRLSRDQKVQAGASATIDHLKQVPIPRSKQLAGSLKGLVAIVIDAKTIIFAKPEQDVSEVRRRYEQRMRFNRQQVADEVEE